MTCSVTKKKEQYFVFQENYFRTVVPEIITAKSIRIVPYLAGQLGSDLYRLVGEFDNNREICFFVKMPVHEEYGNAKRNVKISEEIHRLERLYYTKIVKEYKYRARINLFPKHYESRELNCVILEDVLPGYIIYSYYRMLDLDHCKLYVENVALLHALSNIICFEDNNMPLIIALRGSDALKNSRKERFRTEVLGGFRCMADYLENKPEFNMFFEVLKSAYSKKEYLWRIVYDFYINAFIQAKIRSLIQVDPSSFNMMFKYHDIDNKVIDMKLFDFQHIEFTSGVKELITFMWLSSDEAVRENHLYELYTMYCDLLNANFRKLGYEKSIEKIDNLNDLLLGWSPLVLFTVCVTLPLNLSIESERDEEIVDGRILGFEKARESNLYKKVYTGKAFQRIIPKCLQQIEKLGILQDMKNMLDELKKNDPDSEEIPPVENQPEMNKPNESSPEDSPFKIPAVPEKKYKSMDSPGKSSDLP